MKYYWQRLISCLLTVLIVFSHIVWLCVENAIWIYLYTYVLTRLIALLQNGNIENPYCNGIEGILEAYHQSLKTVQLYGPTNFAPVVNHVARYVALI